MTKKNLLVCRSGGRSSEYKYKRLLEEYSDEYNIIGIFANTGWEHHKTIEFVNNNDVDNREKFGVEPIWVEAVVHDGRVACTHKLVTYETASRNREPMIEVIKKYGLPNAAYPHCTRELKENPIHDYVDSVLGWSNAKKGKISPVTMWFNGALWHKEFEEYYTSLGIRADEPSRILGQKVVNTFKKHGVKNIEDMMIYRSVFLDAMKNEAVIKQFDLKPKAYGAEMLEDRFLTRGVHGLSESFFNDDFWFVVNKFALTDCTQNKVYPLADWFVGAPDKLDILDWWEDYSFDLGIPEHLGNCVGCFRKSEKKCLKAYRDAPEQFVNTMEVDFGHIGPNKIKGKRSKLPRTMYRQYKTSQDIIQMFNDADKHWLSKDDPEHLNEGCASSCEPFSN